MTTSKTHTAWPVIEAGSYQIIRPKAWRRGQQLGTPQVPGHCSDQGLGRCLGRDSSPE
jgi:hypothetical protein